MTTLFTGQNIIHLKSVDSTNSYAAELLRQSKQQEGTLICSFNQTQGRGQRGNSWLSEPNKNATFSIIYYPSFLRPEEQFMLTKIVSVGLAGFMTELLNKGGDDHKIKIKWPNDIYVDEKKIAGVLIENTLSEGSIKSSIIGLGLNVNQTEFEGINATSLALIKSKTFDLMEVIEKTCVFIEAMYLQLKAGKTQEIDRLYLNYLYRLGELKKYITQDGTEIQGTIKGVTKEGYLLLSATGELKEFGLKEISFA